MTALTVLDALVRTGLALVLAAFAIGTIAILTTSPHRPHRTRPRRDDSLCCDDPARLGLLDHLDGIHQPDGGGQG